jgi:hypothetical protein
MFTTPSDLNNLLRINYERSALGDDVDDAAGGPAELRGIAGRLHLDFLDEVREQVLAREAADDVGGLDAVDHVAATLARREDPGEQAYNQACAKVRTDMAVAKGLLEIRGAPGNPEIFLPKEKNPRNVVLASASQMLKATKAGIRAQLESAKDKDHIGKLNRDLGAITDNLGFIEPEATRHAEAELRKFWASSDVKAAVNKVPRGFETKTGPYGDKSQLPLEGARDKTLRQVVDMLAGAIASQAVVRRTSQGILGSGGGPPTPGESPGRGSSATGGGKPTTPPAAAATSGNSGKSSSGGKS